MSCGSRTSPTAILLLLVCIILSFVGVGWLHRDHLVTYARNNHADALYHHPARLGFTIDDTGISPVSYDTTTPPGTGCEAIVEDRRNRLIETYTPWFKGVRYINIWGYLETENKGDAAIWTAQQILLSMFGIQTMEACRYTHVCDMDRYTSVLKQHEPYSAIVMAGGGNFNDYYWDDQPQRILLVDMFHDTKIRAFPQSIYMTKPEKINLTKESFIRHSDLQLAARDRPSFVWLEETFDRSGVNRISAPDIAFMWGNRPDFRLNTVKKYDLLILARNDHEISAGESSSIEWGLGTLQLGSHTITYFKIDWNKLPTPDLPITEEEPSVRAFAKAVEGFRILGSADFIITDRLHGHIMATVIGSPHVLMDSKLGKNLAMHDTWTKHCDCTRVAEGVDGALDYAKMWFDKAYNEGRWSPREVII